MFRIEFRSAETTETLRYVCERKSSSHSSWNTGDKTIARTWYTYNGAQRWIIERPGVVPYMEKHGMKTVIVEC